MDLYQMESDEIGRHRSSDDMESYKARLGNDGKASKRTVQKSDGME